MSGKRNERRNGFISDPRIANNTTTAPAMIVVKLIVIISFFSYFKAFALSGRIANTVLTQGDALGYVLLPFQGVLLSVLCLSGHAFL